MATVTQEKYWTPPEVARRLRVAPEKIIGWILAGELAGVNLADAASSRPRYKICETAIQAFLRQRSASILPTKASRSRLVQTASGEGTTDAR